MVNYSIGFQTEDVKEKAVYWLNMLARGEKKELGQYLHDLLKKEIERRDRKIKVKI